MKREGKRFAHWRPEAGKLLAGNLQPVYRVQRGRSRDIPQHVLEGQKRKRSGDELLDVIMAGSTEERLKVGCKMH